MERKENIYNYRKNANTFENKNLKNCFHCLFLIAIIIENKSCYYYFQCNFQFKKKYSFFILKLTIILINTYR